MDREFLINTSKDKSPVRRRVHSTAGNARDMHPVMTNHDHQAVPSLAPALAGTGAPCWIVTDGKTGMDVQVRGVADALGVAYEMKYVKPRGLYAFAAPWGPVAPSERFGTMGSTFAPPWPALALATGRASIPYMRALHRRAGGETYTVVLQDPRTGAGTADLIWVPAHDKRRGANVITTLTAPHSFSQNRLTRIRSSVPQWIAALPKPRVAVVLGGNSGVFTFTPQDDARLGASITSLAALGASFMITPSRRTHARLTAALEAATAGRPRLMWDQRGENPYPQFLAHADMLIVTADSVNMCGEACATGRPVYVFEPTGGSAKFARYHDGLRKAGATRELPAAFNSLETWSYPPLDSAAIIADEILRRWRP